MQKRSSRLLREIIETVLLTVIIFLAISFVIQSYHVDGSSMEPGLNSRELVMVNKLAYLPIFGKPGRGDVIVFHAPIDPGKDFIKRIIGLPGDTIKTDDTHVWVNGVQLNEPYIMPGGLKSAVLQRTVPADQYFVMGDNRPVSDDSRDWGFVPKDAIVGKAMIVYWPSWEIINTFPAVYANVKAAP